MPYNANENELEILKYWEEHKCFEKSVEGRPANKPYVFYDGPPFATGLPHYGHIVASLMKDVVPRYFTMRGFRVERKWGWDCHGLPIENIIEKDLDLKSKKDIEDYGIDKFNEACRATVLKYAAEWKKTIRRMGRWVDMENAYQTMDLSYMESVWWVFKELWNKGLVYKGHKAMHICPRCVTPLSNFEVTQNYKDVTDISVTVKFKVKNPAAHNLPENTYILAWTTTPWTLPGNVALAIGANIQYSIFNIQDEPDTLIAAKSRLDEILKGKKYQIIKEIDGSSLIGLEYEPLFPYFKDTPSAFRVVGDEIDGLNFVTTEDGTGVVHIAPAFGEDDYKVGRRENIPLVQHVGMDGRFVPAVTDFAGMEVKPTDDPTSTDVAVMKYLHAKGLIFAKEKFTHSYPHCWRCESPLLNYATTSWFVRVTELKEQLLENNQQINWVPEHIKEGRFGEWLAGARDWAISRNRFWGAPLPVWENEDGEAVCVGSAAELENLSGQKITDLHKHHLDKVEITKDGKIYRRIPEVLDCWFESGSMPYGQMHYPFENKEKFEAGFPAEFIAEGQDQTRGWFYTLHVLAAALTMGEKKSIPTKASVPAFKNVIVNGIVLAEDGKKMSKRLKNYPEPELVLEKYGADAMRYYLVTSPAMEAENLNFSEAGVRETYNRILNTLWNVFTFYRMFGGEASSLHLAKGEMQEGVVVFPSYIRGGERELSEVNNVLDRWIIAKLQQLIKNVTAEMDKYHLIKAARPLGDFINELSTWYLRRSRDRFKSEDEDERKTAVAVMRYVLIELSKVMAPFMPFMAEKIYLDLQGDKESVHLEDWPVADEKLIDEKLLNQMETARRICELAHSARKEAGIKVRQPLAKLKVESSKLKVLDENLADLIKDEINVKEIDFVDELPAGENWKIAGDDNLKVALDLEITAGLKAEGILRELVRQINDLRKELKLTIENVITINYQTESEQIKSIFNQYEEKILKDTISTEIRNVYFKDIRGLDKDIEIEGQKLWIGISASRRIGQIKI